MHAEAKFVHSVNYSFNKNIEILRNPLTDLPQILIRERGRNFGTFLA